MCYPFSICPMDIQTHIIELETPGHTEIVDITAEVQQVVTASGLQEGQVCVMGIGSTTGISTLEYEPGLVRHDVKALWEKLAPYGQAYVHNQTWGDDNGSAHLRSFLTGTSLNVPFVQGQLILGTWQQIVFVDFDTQPRQRRIVVQAFGR